MIQSSKTHYPARKIYSSGNHRIRQAKGLSKNSNRYEKNLYFVDPYKSYDLNQTESGRRKYHIFDEGERQSLNKSFAKKSEARREDSISTLETTVYSYSNRKRSRPGSAPAKRIYQRNKASGYAC